MLALVPAATNSGLSPDSDPDEAALTYWGVDDVTIAVDDALSAGAGASEHGPVSDVGDGVITACVKAPSGSIVGFIRNPHFTLT